MAVGDDVVDLGDPQISHSHQRPRFVDRVLTPAERRRLAAAADPQGLLWSLFALKEAAYKAVAQLQAPPGFAYQRFEVAEDLEEVRFGELVLAARVERREELLHAVAWTHRPPALARALSHAGDDPSAAARRALCAAAAKALGCAVEELDVEREPLPGSWDGFGPPRLRRLGRRLLAAVSLSHDGRFISFAAQWPAGDEAAAPR